MIKTINNEELAIIKEKLFFLKSLILSKKYNIFEYANNKIQFKNCFVDQEDEFECKFINNIKTITGKSFVDFELVTGGLEDEEDYDSYNCIIYDLDNINNYFDLYNVEHIFEDVEINLENVSMCYYFMLNNKYIREYFNLYKLSKKKINSLRDILLLNITKCRSYFYSNSNHSDMIGYNGIDIGFNNEEDANMFIICDYQVSVTSLCYALCIMIIYMQNEIKKYYEEELRICQIYHCI